MEKERLRPYPALLVQNNSSFTDTRCNSILTPSKEKDIGLKRQQETENSKQINGLTQKERSDIPWVYMKYGSSSAVVGGS